MYLMFDGLVVIKKKDPSYESVPSISIPIQPSQAPSLPYVSLW